MLVQVRPKDLELFLDISRLPAIERPEDTPLRALIPAFMISELRRAFEIGFLIFVPFLVIDMVVASILMSMGMMMLPPVLISLPFKLIFFVLVDGWYLVVGSLVESFAQLIAGPAGAAERSVVGSPGRELRELIAGPAVRRALPIGASAGAADGSQRRAGSAQACAPARAAHDLPKADVQPRRGPLLRRSRASSRSRRNGVHRAGRYAPPAARARFPGATCPSGRA